MLNDLRHALRLLARNRNFTILACLTLALSVGVNTAIFSVADAALFRPLPYRDAHRLVDVVSQVRHPNGDETGYVGGVSRERLANLRSMTSVFEGVDAYGPGRGMAMANGSEDSVRIASFTPTFPAFLGLRAQLGRTFAPEDVTAGTALVISDGYWKRGFGGDPGVIGRTLALADRTCVIVGVMPPTFRYFAGLATDGWLPLDERKGGYVVARLRPGLTFDQAQRDLNAIVAGGSGLFVERWEVGQQWRLELRRGDWGRSDSASRTMLFSLLGATGLLLLVASANVGNLLLARALTRQREIAVRRALGATRLQLVRQFVIEGVVLGGIGGFAALVLAWWGLKAIPTLVPQRLTFSLFAAYLPQLDPRVFTFGILGSLVTGVICGLAPALGSPRAATIGLDGQKVVGGSRTQGRALDVFQAMQVAITLVLLLASGLLAASLLRMIRTPNGFDSGRLAYIAVNLPAKAYPDPDRQFAFFEDLLGRVRSIAGVEAAALGPAPNSSFSGRFTVEGRDMGDSLNRSLDVFYIGEDYLRVAGIPLKSGRTFARSDAKDGSPVALISENAAARFWPGQSALGQRFRTGPRGQFGTVVGVVGHVKTVHFTSDGVEAYFPIGQDNSAPHSLVVRLEGEAAPVFAAVRAQVAAMEPAARITRAQMVEEIFAEANPLGPPRFYAGLLGGFAALGLLTAAVGLYGMLSYAVGRRTREIGVRMALGADASRVRWLVFANAMTPVFAGIAIGLVAATWLSRFVESQLYQVKPHDPVTFFAVVAVLGVACAAAAYLPARRATRVDPTEALRAD